MKPINLNEITFNSKDVVKLVGFALTIGGMWYDLKTDFKLHVKDYDHLEYRVSQLEKPKEIAQYKPKFAILANRPELKEYE